MGDKPVTHPKSWMDKFVFPQDPTTSFLTATTLIYAIGAGITAAAGTRLALQLLSVRVVNYPHYTSKKSWSCYFLSLPPRVGIGQFSRLLPSVDVVAVSQAPSPKSNPNFSLPVTTMVIQYKTI